MRDSCSAEAVTTMERRQSMTTWGMLALAIFVSVGMAEWSKRMAAGETVIDPAVMEQALKMAAADVLRNSDLGNSNFGERAFVEPIRLTPEVPLKWDFGAAAQKAEISRYPNQNEKSTNN